MVSVSTSRLNLHFFKLLHAPPSTLTRFNCFFTSIFYRKYTSWAHSADTHWGPQVGGGGWIMYSPLLKDADWCQPRLVPACAGPGMLESSEPEEPGPGESWALSTPCTGDNGGEERQRQYGGTSYTGATTSAKTDSTRSTLSQLFRLGEDLI